MITKRVIPCLLLKGNGLYKTRRFKDPTYIGDPVNAVRIFNEKEADELVILDIDASKHNQTLNYRLIDEVAGEAFMPIAYGGGIQSIEKSQVESGLSLGFGKFLLLRKIILPIAIRKVLPSYGNELILMVKATSLVSLTTYMEMTGIARKIMAKTFAPVEAFIAAGILYLFLNFLMVQFVKYLEWKYNPHLRLNN